MPPTAAVARKARARTCMFMAVSTCSRIRCHFRSVERSGKAFLVAVIARAFPEFRTADAGRAVLADDLAVGVLADQVVEEDVLSDDGVAFHAHHFRDVRD